jgi:hypothetical protein
MVSPFSPLVTGHVLHSLHFIYFYEERKEKRERSSPPSAGRNSLGGRTSIVALLQASLHQEKDKLLLGLIFPNLRR